MKMLELRRHTMRNIPGDHINQAGVSLARRVGEGMGRFDFVATSTLPRAFETAIAMGYAVDAQYKTLAEMDVDLSWSNEGQIASIAHALRREYVQAKYSKQQRALLVEIVHRLPKGGAGLIISHGGIVESQAIILTVNEDFDTWGRTFRYCEGVRIWLDDDLNYVRHELLRN
jgi:broad specificity phosphatase PhoE